MPSWFCLKITMEGVGEGTADEVSWVTEPAGWGAGEKDCSKVGSGSLEDPDGGEKAEWTGDSRLGGLAMDSRCFSVTAALSEGMGRTIFPAAV